MLVQISNARNEVLKLHTQLNEVNISTPSDHYFSRTSSACTESGNSPNGPGSRCCRRRMNAVMMRQSNANLGVRILCGRKVDADAFELNKRK